MPLGKSIGDNIRELQSDNHASGQERGANGKVRSKKQILAIALSASRKAGNRKPKGGESMRDDY
ncbi:MAG: DUF6496 domain-containing protein [Candidatus Babeliales bacterium]